jgi:hypothetical protein
MYSIDLNKEILDLDGGSFPEHPTMAEVVANSLAKKLEGDPIKLYELALLVKKGSFSVDTADLDLIEKTIREDSTLTALAKGQILLEIKKQLRSK